MPLDIISLVTGSNRRVSHIRRYSSYPVIREENVAEHTFYTSFYSLLVAKEAISRGIEVDLGDVLQRALLHDYEESYSGDCIRNFKYYDMRLKKLMDEISGKLVYKLFESINKEQVDDLFNIWENSKDNSNEGKIVSFCDILTVIAYSYEELLLGNKHMSSIFFQALNLLSEKFNGFGTEIDLLLEELVIAMLEFYEHRVKPMSDTTIVTIDENSEGIN